MTRASVARGVTAARCIPAPHPSTILAATIALLLTALAATPLAAQSGDSRLHDYRSAPYAAPADAPVGAGAVRALDATIASNASLGRRFLLGDEVRLVLPAGTIPEPGTRLLTVAQDTPLPGGGAVLRPTGVVEILEFEGDLVRGRVVQLLDLMEAGQSLVPLPSAGPTAHSAPGGSAHVTWTDGGARLLSLQDWVLLSPIGGSALAEGDLVSLVEPVRDESGSALGEEIVATARVVRVTTLGASAILTSVRKPATRVGTLARVVPAPR